MNTKKNKTKPLTWTSKLETGIKNPLWIVFMLVILALLVYWGIQNKASSFSFVLVLFALVYALVHIRSSENIKITLTKKHIKIAQQIIPFKEIQSYWFIIQPPMHNYLNIKLKKNFLPPLKINISKHTPEQIREKIAQQIPENKEKQLSLAESLTRIFKI